MILFKKCNIIVIDDFFIDTKHLISASVRGFYLIENNKKYKKKDLLTNMKKGVKWYTRGYIGKKRR